LFLYFTLIFTKITKKCKLGYIVLKNTINSMNFKRKEKRDKIEQNANY
jgi:hypothetical protein